MNFMNLFRIALVAISYFLFSNQFFKFCAEIKGRKASLAARFFSFALVYAWFMTASLLESPLVVNWLFFLILLGLEVHFVFSYDFLTAYTLSLFCIITGLAVNVFFRNLVSILLYVPLNLFDKNLSYLKSYPIFLGFMFMALLLYALRRVQFAAKLERMLHYRKSLLFYTWTEVFIYLFLIVQLLAYTQSENAMGVKIWGIKSALFSIAVLIITIIYSFRTASLHYYMHMQHEARKHLTQGEKDINKLWEFAFTDPLTGCGNRQLLDTRLKEYAGYGGTISLAFIDINGLKGINDQYGHTEGDRYLRSVARILSQVAEGFNIDLFRYGGDEFVMLSNTLSEAEIAVLLAQANSLLRDGKPAHYSKSISYGVVHGDCANYQRLLSAADHMMYQYKQQHYENFLRS